MLLERYVLRAVAAASAAIAVVLVAVFIAYSLARFLTDAASGLLKGWEVAALTLLKSVIALDVLLPLAFYFGVLVGAGRLAAASELTAMQACGFGRERLRRPLLLSALLLAAVVCALSISVRPWAYAKMFALRARADATSELDRIKPRQFYLYDEDDRAIYVEGMGAQGRRLTGIFIRKRSGRGIEIISAPSGLLEPFVTPDRHRLTLDNASVYKDSGSKRDFYGRFDELTVTFKAERPIVHEYRTKAESTPALLEASAPYDRAELQWRFSTPVSTLLLAVTALYLVENRPREGRFARLPVAIGIYAVYYNLLGIGRTWVEQQVLPSIWWAPALLACALPVIAWWAGRR